MNVKAFVAYGCEVPDEETDEEEDENSFTDAVAEEDAPPNEPGDGGSSPSDTL